jgi:hypothetical protein
MKFLKNKALWIAISSVALVIAALAVTGAQPQPGNDNWEKSDQALGRQPEYQDSIEELSVTLTDSGFAPTELRPQGKRFLLSLDNRTDVKELILRMSRKDGAQVREIRVPGGNGDWSELFDLQPGDYTFSEAEHSNWVCTIIIKG